MAKTLILEGKDLTSRGYKEILLKVVVLAIHTFAMSCFKLFKSLCSKLESIMAQFW